MQVNSTFFKSSSIGKERRSTCAVFLQFFLLHWDLVKNRNGNVSTLAFWVPSTGEAWQRWNDSTNRQANKSACKAERKRRFTTPQWTYPWPISLCSLYTLQASLWSVVWSLEVTFLPGGSVFRTLSGLLFMTGQCHRENYSFGIPLHPAGSWPFEWCWQLLQLVPSETAKVALWPKIPSDSSSYHISSSLHWVHVLKHQKASCRLF